MVTNTSPIGAYRGAGRPEAAAAIERAVDLFAAEVGLDPAEVRRRNLLPGRRPPLTTPTRHGLRLRRLPGGPRRALGRRRLRRAARRAGAAPGGAATVALGIGVATLRRGHRRAVRRREFGRVEVRPRPTAASTGRLTGSSPHGQGHATAFAMLAADELGRAARADRGRARRHRPGRPGRGHVRVPLAAARRRRRAGRGRRGGRRGPGAWRPSCSRPPVDDVVLDGDRGAFHVVGTPAVVRGPGREVAGRRRRARGCTPSSTSPPTSRPSRSGPTSRWSRSTPRPARSGCCRLVASTTPAGSSTRCSPRASATAAWPRARPRRCSRRSSTTATATR